MMQTHARTPAFLHAEEQMFLLCQLCLIVFLISSSDLHYILDAYRLPVVYLSESKR